MNDQQSLLEIPGFKIIRPLGEGGIGQVYLAEDERLGRRVAIKIISDSQCKDEEVRRRFQREARAMAMVRHPRVVGVHTFGEVGAQPYLVMQYVDGEDLARRIKRESRLAPDEALRIVRQCLEALDAAWQGGIVHRDVKPSNILLDARRLAHLADFGLARTFRLDDDSTLTRTGHLVGTPYYISPEQARGDRDIDWRCDIYSLGVVFFEMLAGRRPFDGPSPFAVVDQHLHSPLPALADQLPAADPGLGRLLEWMTRKDPADRPASHDELMRQVEVLAAGGAVSVPGPRPGFATPTAPFQEGRESPAEVSGPVFLGREAELGRLNDILKTALAGSGTVAFVTGEAGTGKTALVGEFVRSTLSRYKSLVTVTGNCNAYTGLGDPYLPFREALGLLVGDMEAKWAAGAISGSQARRLWHLLPRTAKALVENGPDLVGTFVPGAALLTRIIGQAPESGDWVGALQRLVEERSRLPATAMAQQSDLFEQYHRVLQAITSEQPLLLVLEDLHWADAGSINLFTHLCRRLADNRFLVIGTFRPAEVAQGRGGQPHPLEPVIKELKQECGAGEVALAQTGKREFVDDLLDHEPNRLDEAFREALFKQTGGHPLFTVELLRAMEAQGALIRDVEGRWVEGPSLEWDALPVRVEAAIGARVERLPRAMRRILLAASVEGGEFTAEVIARVSETDNQQMARLLNNDLNKRLQLVNVQGIQRVDGRQLSRYRFRHILFQRYLYQSLENTQRIYLHQDVGTVLESLHGERRAEIAVQLARHFEQAGVTEKAVGYLHQAGERAARLSADHEAVALFNKGLELLQTVPESPERTQQELALQLGLTVPLQATKGYADADVFEAYSRARELCELAGESPQRFQALMMLSNYHGMRGEYQMALDLGEQMHTIAATAGSDELGAPAHWLIGYSRLSMGDFEHAGMHLGRTIEAYDPQRHRHWVHLYGLDPCVACLAWTSHVLWYRGYPGQALRRSEESIELAREIGHAHTLAFALDIAGLILRMHMRDTEGAKPLLDELLELASEKGLLFYQLLGRFHQGEILSCQGHPERGLGLIDETMAGMEAIGIRSQFSMVIAARAEACRRTGDIDTGLVTIEQSQAHIQNHDEHLYEAEVFRVRGELLAASAGGEDSAGIPGTVSATDAEACFREALSIARHQQAKSWELRAAMSLARFLGENNRPEEGREILAETYGWFTEGFDTPDLVDARALLDELAGN